MLDTEMDSKTVKPVAWTEVSYKPENYNAFVKVGLFDKTTEFRLCREGEEPKTVRQSFVVFRQKGAEEWEDDAPLGLIEAMVLGDDSEEVQPVEIVNLEMPAESFLTIVSQTPESTTVKANWQHGEVTIPFAKRTDEGFILNKADFADGKKLFCELTPENGSVPFQLEIELPFVGFSLFDAEGNMVVGNLEIDADDLKHYTYKFLGNESDDRFAISFDDLSLAYQYVWYEDGTLSIRNQRRKMEKVGETKAVGTLEELLNGSRNALIKHKDTRWRITVTGNELLADEHEMATDPILLAREVFSAIKSGKEEEERLTKRLLKMQNEQLFQWFWLKQEDWSHEHLLDLLDMEDAEQDQQKMLEQALLYNRFDVFMQKLRKASLQLESETPGDALQARNNKRKIARVQHLYDRHFSGESVLWNSDFSLREEMLNIHWNFRTYLEID